MAPRRAMAARAFSAAACARNTRTRAGSPETAWWTRISETSVDSAGSESASR